jgi:hypothetical protein
MRTALLHGQPIPKPNPDSADPRLLWETDLSALVERVETLNKIDKSRLYTLLEKYLRHLTTRPGKCNIFTYEFQVTADKPIVGYSGPIPFCIRPAVREKINQDDILEIILRPS